MANIIIYTKDFCPYCDRAKELLKNKGLSWDEIRVDIDTNQLQEMIDKSGRRTVPQIFINKLSIGGFDDLNLLEQTGKLDTLINNKD